VLQGTLLCVDPTASHVAAARPCRGGYPPAARVAESIGTVHAIACCNACEMAMGMLAEATIPDRLRWLPKAMTVKYLKKANGELRAVASLALDAFAEGEVVVPVDVYDAAGDIVVHADIALHVTSKR